MLCAISTLYPPVSYLAPVFSCLIWHIIGHLRYSASNMQESGGWWEWGGGGSYALRPQVSEILKL